MNAKEHVNTMATASAWTHPTWTDVQHLNHWATHYVKNLKCQLIGIGLFSKESSLGKWVFSMNCLLTDSSFVKNKSIISGLSLRSFSSSRLEHKSTQVLLIILAWHYFTRTGRGADVVHFKLNWERKPVVKEGAPSLKWSDHDTFNSNCRNGFH